MKKLKVGIVSLVCLVTMGIVFAMTGCAKLADMVSTAKGSLIGNAYTVYQYDNTGNQTMEYGGKHIDISPYKPKEKKDGSTVINDVLDITIDGSEVLGVGNTLLFEEKGLDKLAGFSDISKFANESAKTGAHFIPYDKFINNIKNNVGKSRLILVYSQMGEPLAMYQGENVYVTVPDDLPKMTRLNIDGKSLYLHRVNYTIIDMSLLKK